MELEKCALGSDRENLDSLVLNSIKSALYHDHSKPICFVCRKSEEPMVCPCQCPGKFVHQACLIEGWIIPQLDRPCPACALFMQSNLIVERTNLAQNTQRTICDRNIEVFEAILISITSATFIVWAINSAWGSNASSSQREPAFTDRLRSTLAFPFQILTISILIYQLFQLYLLRPIGVHYFDNGRSVKLLYPKTHKTIHLLIKHRYGLVIRPEGERQLIDRHCYQTHRHPPIRAPKSSGPVTSCLNRPG